MKELTPSELMIGNLVLDSTKNTTLVETIIPEHNRVYYGKPLTEDWLLKYGFKKSSFGMINITPECIVDPKANTIGFYSDYHEDDITFKLPKYVHQLQNLFYIITGAKLSVKGDKGNG